MIKHSVKKPYTVLVAVVMLIVLGIVSFTKLTTDLLPQISLPYIMIISTYPGASPQKVESDVSKPLESGLGRINGVKTVSSTSSENYGMLVLEFEDDTNMDTAMVKVSTALDQVVLPDEVGKPVIMELSPDMLASMYVAVDYDGKDSFELTKFANDVVIPYMEKQDGVASVDATGLIDKTVEIRLNQDKIDDVNARVKAIAQDKLDDAQKELDDAKDELSSNKKKLKDGQNTLKQQQDEKTKELAEADKQLDSAMAMKAGQSATLTQLQISQKVLEAEKQAYEDNKIQSTYDQLNDGFKKAKDQLDSEQSYQAIYGKIYSQVRNAAVTQALAQAGMTDITIDDTNVETYMAYLPQDAQQLITAQAEQTADEMTKQTISDQKSKIPDDIKDALDNPKKLSAYQNMLKEAGQEEAASKITKKTLQSVSDIVNVRIPQIDAELANLKMEIQGAQMAEEKMNSALQEADDAYVELEAGKIAAAAGFGSAAAQLNSGLSQIEQGQKQIDDAQSQLDDAKEEALDNANLNQLLTKETLSQMLSAQNFSMPAGYLNTQSDTEKAVLVKIGDSFDDIEQIENMLLVNMDKLGDVRIKDVADVVVTDNSKDSHAMVDGNHAVILAVSKASTAGTSSVCKNCHAAIKELQDKYEGLHITPVMDQGAYIKLIVNSVLSNLIWGALLAVIVLAIFLKDVKPTIVVAFSIPMSVLFAIVLMYFSNITLNIISLSGLALGIGMLVDNSIVVIENIYRLRNEGVPAPTAAVRGAKQVAGAIAASTLTTICVFLPIAFTQGLTRQLFTDMALTITYSLMASLIVALTFVPCMSATVMKNASEKKHRLFDKMVSGYEKVLKFFLRFKLIPVIAAIVLLIICVISAFKTGIIMMPQMGGDQMGISFSVEDSVPVEEGYQLADEVVQKLLEIDGIDKVALRTGNGSAVQILSAGSNRDFNCMILLTDAAGKNNTVIADQIEKMMKENFEGIPFEVTTSNMDISMLTGSGMELVIEGDDIDTLLSISKDMEDMLGTIEGFTDITNGQDEGQKQMVVTVDKDKAMRLGITTAQLFMKLSGTLDTDLNSITLTDQTDEYQVVLIDETQKLTKDNLMDYEFETTKKDSDGKDVKETHKLSEVAVMEEKDSVTQIQRENQARKISVTAGVKDGYNTTLLSRTVEEKLADYSAPEGYSIEIAGESTAVLQMLNDMLLMILLAVIFIYLIMVAQFQSLLSPFIVLFTIPLAFTGGFLGLMITHTEISMIAMMGFLILSGVVVNNGIVFVDYVNQMRLAGMDKREALLETGKARIRPILMTALTTIFAMLTLLLSRDASAVMSRGMVVVTVGGLLYATLMTLFIIPVLYDIFYRRDVVNVVIEEEGQSSNT